MDDPGTGFNATSGAFQLRGVPPVPGVFFPTFTVSDAGGTRTASTELVITGNYAYWRDTQFDPAELPDPGLSGPLGSAVGDGIANVFRYAFGSSGHAPMLPGGVPQLGRVSLAGEDYLTLTYTHDLTATDVTLTVRVSENLVDWNSGPAFTTEVSRTDHHDGTETVVVRDLLPLREGPRRFLQLQATLAP